MSDTETALIIVAIVGAFATIGAAWRAGRAAEHTPYDKLAARVMALEDADEKKQARISKLERRESALVRYIRELLVWVERNSKEDDPPPSPPLDLVELIAGWEGPAHRTK